MQLNNQTINWLKKLIIQRNIKAYCKSGVFILFDPLIPKFYRVSNYVYDLFLLISQNAANMLHDINTQYSEEILNGLQKEMTALRAFGCTDDLKTFCTPFYPKEGKPDIDTLFLIPTTKCNFACSYCHFMKNKSIKRTDVMSYQTMKSALDFFDRNSVNSTKRNIIFYGGEPLLNFGIIEKCLEHYICSGINKPEFSLFTNCSVITPFIAKKLSKSNVKVIVSIDGDQISHDNIRKYTSGRGTYKDVINGFRLLKHHGCEVGISCTVGVHNVERLDIICNELINKFHPSNLGFNMLHRMILRENPFQVEINFMNQMLLKAYEICMSEGVYLVHAINRLRPIVEQRPRVQDCPAYGRQIVITPEGRIGPCEVFASSDLFFEKFSPTKDLNNYTVIKEWANRFPIKFKGCAECLAISMCGGGCAYDAFLQSGTINFPDERVCRQSFAFLNWAAFEILKGLKNYPIGNMFISEVPKKVLKSLYGKIDVSATRYPLTIYHSKMNIKLK